WHAPAGSRPLRAARDRAPEPCLAAARERDFPAYRVGGGLALARHDPRPGCRPEALPHLLHARPGRSRPARLGLRHAREPPDRRSADRDGERFRNARALAAKTRPAAASPAGPGSPRATTISTTSPPSRRAARA